jgi:drug/metabolite transporter (DMT)-like permease
LYTWKPFKALEVCLMAVGVVCAVVFTWADFKGEITLGGRFIGVLGCLGSLFCGSLNLALAGVLGETKLNVLDTVAYMAIPATLFLLPIILFVPKPVPGEWVNVGTESMTDWQILRETWYYSKETCLWLFLSGFFSFAYNIVQFTIVHTLSPSATAFGGNFNKAALTFMTLLLPFLQTKPNPPMPYIGCEWAALLVNIYAFTHYSYLQIKAKQEAEAKKHRELNNDEDEESEDEESGSGSE